MLFMVIERFRDGNPALIGDRYRERGRMMPIDVIYHASWIDTDGSRCFQVMEAPSSNALEPWMANWSDLVDFEVVPVLSSADFWTRTNNA